MPNLAVWHPQLVHFVIALGLVGVVLRLLSLLLRSAWLSPPAGRRPVSRRPERP